VISSLDANDVFLFAGKPRSVVKRLLSSNEGCCLLTKRFSLSAKNSLQNPRSNDVQTSEFALAFLYSLPPSIHTSLPLCPSPSVSPSRLSGSSGGEGGIKWRKGQITVVLKSPQNTLRACTAGERV